MSNNKTHGIELARQQFFKDLQDDTDFIKYKERARARCNRYSPSYGVLVAGTNHYILNKIGSRSETLIAQFLRQFKYINHVRTI